MIYLKGKMYLEGWGKIGIAFGPFKNSEEANKWWEDHKDFPDFCNTVRPKLCTLST